MWNSLPPFAAFDFLTTFAPAPEESAPDPAPRQDAAPDSTVARPESVPAFVVVWEWQR